MTSLDVSVTFLDRDIVADLQVADGETVAILGPNGAGKSSLLAAVAGTLRPDSGRGTLSGSEMSGSEMSGSGMSGSGMSGSGMFDIGGSGPDVWVPPHARGIALMAQDPLLFPHLSVLDNVAFGPRSTGASRSESRVAARGWLQEVDAVDLADRKPSQLSGGQAQRIAVARALAAEPALLLLDEPMAALDVTVVPAVRAMLRRVLAGRTAVIVTHDVLDALLLADRVVVMEAGRIVEEGPTADVLARPRSRFGASIAGLNLLRGTAAGGTVRTPDDIVISGLSDEVLPDGAAAVAVFSPSSVGVFLEPSSGSPRNVFARRVRELEPRGAQVRVRCDDISADVTLAAVAGLGLEPETDVHLVVKASEVQIYPA